MGHMLADEVEELRQLLEQRTQELEEMQLETLSFFYRRYPVVVATFCDETLDPSGALLGRVREYSK